MVKKITDMRNTTKVILSILALLIAVMYIFVSWGKATWLQYIALISSGFIAIFLLSKGAIYDYFRKKEYKKIGFGDVIAWVTFGTGILMLVSFLLLIQVIQNQAPDWLLTFMAGYGTTIGILAGILVVYHMFAPTPK